MKKLQFLCLIGSFVVAGSSIAAYHSQCQNIAQWSQDRAYKKDDLVHTSDYLFRAKEDVSGVFPNSPNAKSFYTKLGACKATDFSDFSDGYNGWVLKDAAQSKNASQLESVKIESAGDFHVLQFYTQSNLSHDYSGVVMEKKIEVEPGKTYQVKLRVARFVGNDGENGTLPQLSLQVNNHMITDGITKISDIWQWKVLEGKFKATSKEAFLQLKSHESSGYGNDYSIRDVIVEEVVEDSSNHEVMQSTCCAAMASCLASQAK